MELQMDVTKLTQELENSIMTKNERNAREVLTRLLDFGIYFQFTFEEKAKPAPPKPAPPKPAPPIPEPAVIKKNEGALIFFFK